MNTVEHLRELFCYNDWANRQIIASLKEKSTEKAISILAHLLTTEAEYFERLSGKDSTGFNFWPGLSIGECGALAAENSAKYEKMLEVSPDVHLDQIAKYKTSEGHPKENTYREMVTHTLLHSAIHRGSIILNLRESGIAPPQTDYIIYLRETKYN